MGITVSKLTNYNYTANYSQAITFPPKGGGM